MRMAAVDLSTGRSHNRQSKQSPGSIQTMGTRRSDGVLGNDSSRRGEAGGYQAAPPPPPRMPRDGGNAASGAMSHRPQHGGRGGRLSEGIPEDGDHVAETPSAPKVCVSQGNPETDLLRGFFNRNSPYAVRLPPETGTTLGNCLPASGLRPRSNRRKRPGSGSCIVCKKRSD